jgi:hypothetical protein
VVSNRVLIVTPTGQPPALPHASPAIQLPSRTRSSRTGTTNSARPSLADEDQ